jgi:hypothetical protein
VEEATSGLDELDQVYDASMRLWAETSVVEVARWLDPLLTGVPGVLFRRLAASLVVPVMTADLLVQAGDKQLLHVEFETSPEADLVQRMFEYRGRIMRLFPEFRLTQYVIVLGSGNVVGFDDLERFGFALDVRVIYLRERNQEDFLTNVLLAPFAVLARGSRAEREQSLGRAMKFLRDCGDPRARIQLQVLDGLAGIVLNRSVVERIGKENGMNYEPLVKFYLGTEVGQRIKGLGVDEGRQEGNLSRKRLLLAWLRTRFGDNPDVRSAADRLAGWDEEAAAAAIIAASDPVELLQVAAPSGH